MPFDGLRFLETLPPWNGRSSFDLAVPKTLLAQLGNPQDKVKAVHVAGTNGKGTVCCYLAAMLLASGHSVAQLASPHLSQVNERFLFNGQPVSDEELSWAIGQVREIAQREFLEPSYFEYTTCAFFLLAVERKVDWMIVEVGLGGRLDATNTMSLPFLSVITGIDFDHTDLLGESLASIAREKAGIAKPQGTLLVGEVASEARRAIIEVAGAVGSKIEFFNGEASVGNSILGYQRRNAALAQRAAEILGIGSSARQFGLLAARWPGRLEWLDLPDSSGKVLFDVAHNAQGTEALLCYLDSWMKQHPLSDRCVFLLSILSTKDWKAILRIYRQFAETHQHCCRCEWVFSCSMNHLSVSPIELRDELGTGEVVVDSKEALHRSLTQLNNSSILVVSGSIYFVGELRPQLVSGKFETFCALPEFQNHSKAMARG